MGNNNASEDKLGGDKIMAIKIHSCIQSPAKDDKYTSEELARITPYGKCVTASKEDVFAIVLASAKTTKRPKDPIIEAIGSTYKIAK
ncbi:hypothetical protein ACFK06_000341 [Salmonella enterica]|uniref:Uncharacterized protein n=1 Tax=Salmonella enterica subsp. salamae serovar 47:b:1,5 TaxID=1967619 RepID=A0A735HHT1_SALER|nr:hypothetical protein [Salmonella enterica]ECE6505538.1 hypothetical protein [Salmonella enterica subsp. salamae]EKR1460085.1 hypothetical protein [Salmonella enterica subsp. salamae serovar 47:b:1,5]EAX8726873.1 hypothetical protein [Salmonella enterica]EBA0244934.1 hypothetical protein [Salmonella enterica]